MTYDPYKDGMTQGILTTFMRCREEAKNYLEGLEQVRTSAALQFGSLAHRTLENIYRKWKKPPTEKEVGTVLDSVHDEFMKEEGARLSPEGLENLHTNAAVLEAVMPSYFTHNAEDFKTHNWLELEEKFCVPSPVPGVNLVGRIDGVHKQKKEVWLFESKTKSRIEEDNLTDALSFDFQTNVYQYAVRHKYKVTPQGVLYNIIRRPGQKLKKDENLVAFSKRIQEEVKKDPSYYFLRYEISIPKTEFARFEGELKSIIEEFLKWWKGDLAHYRNTSSCLQRFGPCRFLPKCANNDLGLYNQRKFLFPELQD